MKDATMQRQDTQSNSLVKDFMIAMREQFGLFQFRAVSAKGHEVKSDGWKECPYKLEVPATPYEHRGKK